MKPIVDVQHLYMTLHKVLKQCLDINDIGLSQFGLPFERIQVPIMQLRWEWDRLCTQEVFPQ